MEIKKTIKLNITIKDGQIICPDMTTLQLVMGTKGVTGNLEIYGVKKINSPRAFVVPVEVIRKRIVVVQNRLNHLSESLEIMKQVVGK